MEDDSFKVYVFDSVSAAPKIIVKEAPLVYIDIHGNLQERAAQTIRALKPMNKGSKALNAAFFQDMLKDAYDNGMCGVPDKTITRGFFDYARENPIIILIVNNSIRPVLLADEEPVMEPRVSELEAVAAPEEGHGYFLRGGAAIAPARTGRARRDRGAVGEAGGAGAIARVAPYNLRKQDEIVFRSRPIVRAFVLAKPEPTAFGTNAFYIDLICSTARSDQSKPPVDTRYVARNMLTLATAYAISTRHSEVSLSAVPELLLRYPNWGFEFRTDCVTPAVVIPPDLQRQRFISLEEHNERVAQEKAAQDALLLMKESRGEGLTRKEARMLKMKANTVIASHAIYLEENKRFLDFMMLLRDKELEHDHLYDPKKDRLCKNKRLSASRVKKLGCEQDGYKMRLCDILPK